MRVLITGVAGFIGSTLADALLARGDHVIGIDCFTPYYDELVKRANVPAGVQLVEADLRDPEVELAPLLDGADVVFHQAAQPGVRLSWSTGFTEYASHNILATQRLLEAAVAAGTPRFVFASSSSVYGPSSSYPTSEDQLPQPHSPYGVTKLAGEHLCGLYAANWGLSTVSLRYFTVYGPRQRPDMAIHRLLMAALTRSPFPLFGDGTAVRDFTYVDDVVAATMAAAAAAVPAGTVMNVSGGSTTSMASLVALVEDLAGRPVAVEQLDAAAGDVDRTAGDITLARQLLGWSPQVPIEVGVEQQLGWLRAHA